MSQLGQSEASQPFLVQGPDGRIVEYPPLPSGYKLDAPAIPPLPPGFTLDKPVTLVPVDHDPFAQQPQPKLVPVDYDPFAGATKQPGMFDDLIPVPASPAAQPVAPQPQGGMFDDLIPAQPPASQAAPVGAIAPAVPGRFDIPGMPGSSTPAAPVAAPQAAPVAVAVPVQQINTGEAAPTTRITATPQRADRPMSLLPSSAAGAARDFQVGAQGVGKGLTDVVTAPFDLVAGAQNLLTGGINRIFGTNIPQATPASKIVERVTDELPGIDPATMSNSEKLAYNINRFGTQALGTGAALTTRAPALAARTMPSASRAPALAAQTMPSATAGGRALDTLVSPYVEAPARTVVGDTLGGMGAGAAQTANDDYIPEHPVGGDWIKTTANVVAPLAGAMSANTLQSAGEGIGGLLRNLATKTFTPAPREIPLNPNTKAPYSPADVDRAATRLQAAATGAPRALAKDIRENASAFTNPVEEGASPVNTSALPTSALLSRDPGLIALEQKARTRQPADFIERDQNVKETAAQRVQDMRDEDADLNAPKSLAATLRERALAAPQQRVAQAEQELTAALRARQDQGASLGAIANSEARASASSRLDRALVDESYVPARAEKNRQFDTAPGRTDKLPADDVFDAIDAIRANANRLAPGTLPGDFMHRLDALRPVIHPETGENIGGPGTARGGDLADLRKFIGPAREQAQQTGNFDLADNLGRLQRAINRTITEAPGYAEANANYQTFADRFRPSRDDEMARFTRAIDRGGQGPEGDLNRGATPPSETAARFLASPEKAATLTRALENSPAEPTGTAALRDFLRSGFATSALNGDGTVNPLRASAWARNNADILAQFPAVRSEFDDIVASARRGEQMSSQARTNLDAAMKARSATEADVDRSAIGTLLKEDPRDVAVKILNGGYNREAKLDEINKLVKNDEQAQRGWKAAVTEVLADKVQGTRQVGETPEVQFARLAKEFKDNETLLGKTFSPEEMNSLRQAHTLLGYFKEAEKRATVGSDTAEKWTVPGAAQLFLRHIYGDLKGGGIVRRFKLLLEQLPNNKQRADEIVQMAWFNPDVAAYLLDRPLKNPNVSQYSINLRRLIAAANEARDSGPSD